MSPATADIGAVIASFKQSLLDEWIGQLTANMNEGIGKTQLKQHCSQFLDSLVRAAQSGQLHSIEGPAWEDMRALLHDIAQARIKLGFTPSQTATFIFSLKQPLFGRLRSEYAARPEVLAEQTWLASALIDQLGLYIIELYTRSRDQTIARQQQELLELSTPVVKLWHNILALPLIGTLDSSRTQIVMESLLEKIVETGAVIAIIDITGVPTVDTLVAQHLLKTVAAARLMGADCIISGIRPQIAQTIVHLGVNLEEVTTKATLADAFLVALGRTGATVSGFGITGPTGGSH
jgi:rsbT co-antagonist protein RsbR